MPLRVLLVVGILSGAVIGGITHALDFGEMPLQGLFDAFTIGERPAGSQVFHSVGLGLAFCKMAVEAHGGSIHLESPCPSYEEKDGVEVSVLLPSHEGG